MADNKEQFKNYRVGKIIGRGRFAIVYKAEKLDVRKTVALKVLNPEYASRTDIRDQFREQARQQAKLTHPRLVRVDDLREENGQFFVAMEYMTLGGLSSWIAQNGVLSFRQAAVIIRDIAEALDYLHGHSLVHEDVKPGNILLMEDPNQKRVLRAKLSDLRPPLTSEVSQTVTEDLIEPIPEYISPEQAGGTLATPLSDQYSLGVVAYEMLCGQPPFTGKSQVDLYIDHQRTRPPSLQQLNDQVTPELEQVILRALEKSPENRYPSCGEFARALRAAMPLSVLEQEIQPIEVGKLFSVSTDQASGADQLNYARFANAFATLIRNPESKTPITIGVYGQWGSGKSFLMKKIIETLKGDQSIPKTPGMRISDTFKRLFERKTDPRVETIIIEFNAWVYSGSEHLWASLVTHLYREIERYFGVRAHYHRLIKAFRRFIPKTIGVFLFYAIPALLISLLVGFDNIQKTWEAANIALKAVGVSVVGGSLLATLPVLWSALREFADTLFMSRAMNLQQLAAKPDFRDQIGIMADIKSEIGFISHLLETRNKRQQTRIVLFIDDLDRCEHRKAVEVLQAIMLLLADRDGSPFVIFLGIDARVIVRAVEEYYGDVLVKAGINGYEYLDKIVQMPFVIPSASRKDIGNYVESLIWTKAEKDLVESKFAPKPLEDKTDRPNEPSKEMPAIETKKEPEIPTSVPTEEPATQIKTEAVPVTFTRPEREALQACVDDIVDNPRKIKRIVNIYRFVRLLLPPNFQQHQKIIRWILLTEQWPLHAAWIVEEIENDYFLKGKLSKKKNATIIDVYHQVKGNIYSDDMDPLMTIDADPIVFNQFIQKKPVFKVQEIYNLLYPLTFNLNPAIKSEISKYTARMAENYIQIRSNRKSRNHKSPLQSEETKSATVKKAIQAIEETETKV